LSTGRVPGPPEKFRRAFGTTNEQLRDRVLDRLDELIEQKAQQLQEPADSVNLESYLAGKRGREAPTGSPIPSLEGGAAM
jgi:hypothetical protein